jgi:hypothetical protein
MREIKPENFEFISYCKEVIPGTRALEAFGFNPARAKVYVDDHGRLHMSEVGVDTFSLDPESWKEIPPRS